MGQRLRVHGTSDYHKRRTIGQFHDISSPTWETHVCIESGLIDESQGIEQSQMLQVLKSLLLWLETCRRLDEAARDSKQYHRGQMPKKRFIPMYNDAQHHVLEPSVDLAQG